MNYSAVILTWNGLELTKNAVSSLLRTSEMCDELIFVDNESTDGTLEWIKGLQDLQKNYPERLCVKKIILVDEKNKGFSAAFNIGISKAKNRYVIVCNNDIICTPRSLDNLFTAMSIHKDYAVMASTTNNCGQSLQWFPDQRCCKPAIISSDDVNFVCVGLDKNFWRAFPLDENYISGVEDIDYCWTVNNNKRKVGVCLASFVYHVGSQTNINEFGEEKMNNNLVHGWKYFAEKWGELGRIRAGEYLK